MSLSPTTAKIKIKELQLLEIESNSLSKYTKKTPSSPPYHHYCLSPQDKLLERLKAHEILSFGSDFNRVLQAFGFLLLTTIYGQTLNESLLNTLKINLYQDSIDLTSIRSSPLKEVTNSQMKKFVVQFFIELCFTDFKIVFFKTISKYPVIIDILTLFFRCLLVQLGLRDAQIYSNKLPTNTVVELLSEFFDLNYRQTKGVYLYIETPIFVFPINSEEILVGKYGDRNYQQNEIRKPYIKQSEENNRGFLADKQEDINLTESNAPTPQFSSEDMNQIGFQASTEVLFQAQKSSYPPSRVKQHNSIQNDSSPFQEVKTPSADSSLYFRQVLFSPIVPVSSSPKSNSKHCFDDVAGENDHLFVNNHNLSRQGEKDSPSECSCKKQIRVNLKLQSQLYSIRIGSKDSFPQEGKNIFKGKYKFRKFSEIQSKKKEQPSPSITPREITMNSTDRSFTSISVPLTPPTTPTSSKCTVKTQLSIERGAVGVGEPLGPKFQFSRAKIKFNYLTVG